MNKFVVFCFSIAVYCSPLPASPEPLLHQPEAGSGLTAHPVLHARHEIIVAANPYAAAAGARILRKGGNAVDAAIAAAFVLNLVEPQSSGIGGGGFMLIYRHRPERILAYDGREKAPLHAPEDMFMQPDGTPLPYQKAVVGGQSVGAPGLLKLLATAHRKQGRLPWPALLQPAITLAEHGFRISPRLHIMLLKDRALPLQPVARAYFFQAGGSPKPVGALLTNKAFARTLRQIAKYGPVSFYQGRIGRDIITAVHRHAPYPAYLEAEDLQHYQVRPRKPVCGAYHSYRICSMPPPSSGGIAVLQTLGILEHFPLARLNPLLPEAVYLITEAERLAFADRNYYVADPDYVSVPIEGLLAPTYIQQRASLIRMDRSLGIAQPGQPDGAGRIWPGQDSTYEVPGTTHLVVADRWGNVVSMTASIGDAFGSRQMVDGFLLNNHMTDFAFTPTKDGRRVANRIGPGKRPRSTMAPTLVFDSSGRIIGAVGTPGGSAIAFYLVKTLTDVLDWKMDLQQAIALPNFGNRNGPTELESGTSLEALEPALKGLGDEIRIHELTSGIHGIMRSGNEWISGADPRREGMAAGR